MKKYLMTLILLAGIFTFTACSNNDDPVVDPINDTPTYTAPDESAAPAEQPSANLDDADFEFDIDDPSTWHIELEGVRLMMGMTVDELAQYMPFSDFDAERHVGQFGFNSRESNTGIWLNAGRWRYIGDEPSDRVVGLAELADEQIWGFTMTPITAQSLNDYILFFPSIRFGETTEADIRRLFGEPTNVGESDVSIQVHFLQENPGSLMPHYNTSMVIFTFSTDDQTLNGIMLSGALE